MMRRVRGESVLADAMTDAELPCRPCSLLLTQLSVSSLFFVLVVGEEEPMAVAPRERQMLGHTQCTLFPSECEFFYSVTVRSFIRRLLGEQAAGPVIKQATGGLYHDAWPHHGSKSGFSSFSFSMSRRDPISVMHRPNKAIMAMRFGILDVDPISVSFEKTSSFYDDSR